MLPNPLLQLRNVSKSFAGVKALEEVRLDVEAGRVHALMGENGAGKSTLMKILGGLHQPDAGEIRFKGRRIHHRSPHDALRLGIAMIHQELLPFRDLSVAANIGMGREATRWFPGWLDHGAMNREATTLLSRLGVPIEPTRRMRELGVAEMQTVEIVKALAHEASVIIMDEPTTALSEREVAALFDVIRELKQRGVAVIYISHKMDEIFRIADTITVMRDGHHVATRPAAELAERELIRLMVGRDPAQRAAVPGNPGAPVLEVRGLTLPGRFHDVSFTLRRGEILGVGGLMGAGRTEVANALYGLAPATVGEIRVAGKTVRIASPADALKAGIALVTEDRKRFGLVPRMSVQQNLSLASMRTRWIDRRAEAAVADDQIRKFSIKAAGRDQPVVNLSGGNQQKVVIAKALLTEPEILILDEPTRGIDVGAKAEIHSLISRLARTGKAILVISSELPELLSLSDRLLVMREGEVTAELDPLHTSQEEIMSFAMPL
ncbi:MAG: sugar ABC transporter ATP-binding protein [Akkermansiaceae bacterium]|nr:sugar ABC transporter ATP-binding protein [Akkermansiaceae bacterium]MCF7730816.1 sugar ABC transporter ATP-binding protein [Akkermansiaceae bacterium]